MSNLHLSLAAAVLVLFVFGGRGFSVAADNPLGEPSDPFAGSYEGQHFSATFTASGNGGYTGQIKLGDKTFPLQAQRTGSELQGKFSAGANAFDFTATLSGRELSFTTGGAHYQLERVSGSVNPLAAGSHASPPAPAAAAPAGDAPPAASDAAPLPDVALPKGFSELGSTPSGRAIFSNFANIGSIDDLIQHVGDAIGGMFGAKPRFVSACVDAKNKNGGIANFSDTLGGAPIKGVVFFGLNPQGASSATVIYSRPNIPHDEFVTLMQTVPAQPKMHTVQAQDGSGSIDIAEGWTLKSPSMTAGPIFVLGPDRQGMIVGEMIQVAAPDGQRVRTAMGLYHSQLNMYRMAGSRGPAPQPPPIEKFMIVSPPLGPQEAFEQIVPKVAQKMRDAGKPWQDYGPIIAKQMLPPPSNTMEAAVIAAPFHWHAGDKVGPEFRSMLKITTSKPDATGTWVIRMDQYAAPKATAARDFPVMFQMYASINIPQAAINRQLDKDNQAFQAISAASQQQHEALMARGRQFQENQKEQFQRFEQQQAAQAQARHDACSDMIESSLGVRDVLDTNTGEMHKVDLYNSTAITDTLNGLANDPNRFIQIPLRYER